MVETPAAVFLIDQILDEVDFVSLGTNDCTQFVLAADAMPSISSTAALLVGLGVRELSMSPLRAARVRHAIARIERREAEALASEALACRTNVEAKDRLAVFAREILDGRDATRG